MDEFLAQTPPTTTGPLPVPVSWAGVAAVAQRQPAWLLGWQVLVALVSAVVVAWSLNATWGRSFRRAADALPDSGSITHGQLEWTAAAPSILHPGPYLSIVVDPSSQHEAGLTADMTLSIERDQWALRSIFGWCFLPYPPEFSLPLDRVHVAGWIAAWNGPLVLGTALAVFLGLFLSWTVLATAYSAFVWAVATPLGRGVSIGIAWRLAAAALLAPALLMTAAIALYATRQLGVVGLLMALPLHLVVGWIYCAGALTRLPKAAANPFQTETPPLSKPQRSRSENPFRTP